MISITFLLLLFFRDLHLSRVEGIILFSLLVAYLIFLFIKKEVLEEEGIAGEKATWKDYCILPASIAGVVAGGHFLVESASAIASAMGVSPLGYRGDNCCRRHLGP